MLQYSPKDTPGPASYSSRTLHGGCMVTRMTLVSGHPETVTVPLSWTLGNAGNYSAWLGLVPF